MSDKTQTFKHPSYGLISFSRRQGSPKLFGSALDTHYHYVTLSIGYCTLHRDEQGDRYYGSMRGEIVEVNLSAAQFAELITTMNMGMGTPCTLAYINKERIESPPDMPTEAQSVRDGFDDSLRGFVRKLSEKAAEVRACLQKKSLSQGDRQRISGLIDEAVLELSSNAPFIIDMFREATERIMTAAKTEADAWLTSVIQRAGLKAIQSGAVPELTSARSAADRCLACAGMEGADHTCGEPGGAH